jgi:hypothetical protein
MHGFWPIFFLLVVLKVPVFSALGLVWWASKQTPENEEAEDNNEGGPDRWRPLRPRPRGPHNGPLGGGAKKRIRTHPTEPAPFGRSQVPLDGHGSASPDRARQPG